MAKRVFFSFHYKDVVDFRANVVRNHWMTKPDRESRGYYDASIWESARKQGDIALKRLINDGLEQTSNTCVLIGSQTFERPWVRYELLKSFKKGNHIFGVHINSIRAKDGTTKNKGANPLEYVAVSYSDSGLTATLWEKTNGKWLEYDKIDGSASYRVNVKKEYQGNSYNLSRFYSVYDWVGDDGFNNFVTWVG
ncbi:MAG: TIR domain-containing protein [Azoarcus sp.]|nr:TIR domain-containing protein [Azoarcus sp.]